MTDAAAPPLDELVAGLAVDVPDFPEPGVLFRDLTPVFADGAAFRRVVDGLAAPSLSDPRAAALADGGTQAAGDAGFDVVVESPSSVRREPGSGGTSTPRPGARPQRPGRPAGKRRR